MVLVVIGILAALLLPAVSRAKASARSAACKSNLRQLAAAMNMYVGDHNQYPGLYALWDAPDDKEGTINMAYGYRKWLPYVANNRLVFACPAQRPPPVIKPLSIRIDDDPLSYGWNALGTGGNAQPRQVLGLGPKGHGETRRNVADPLVKAPADMIAMADNLQGRVDDVLIAPIPMRFTSTLWLPGVRHQAGANVAFCDGHVEYGTQKQLTAATDDARKRWNNDNAPHRETW